MRRLRNGALALVALALGTQAARPDDAEKMVAEEGAIHVLLLREKCVRDELKLTVTEARKIHEHSEKQWNRAQEIHKLPREQRESRYEALAVENEQFVGQVLDAAQRKRLDQISLQVAGLLLATSPSVAAQLGLTDDQKQQLKQHQKEAREEMGHALGTKGKAEREAKIAELRKTSRKRLNDVLTDEQEAKWKEMTGEKFEGKFEYDTGESK